MLGRLLAARDADNAADRLSETEVTNQVLLFLIAGRETTAMTLACTLAQLALSPEWQTKLRAQRSPSGCTDERRRPTRSRSWNGPTASCGNACAFFLVPTG